MDGSSQTGHDLDKYETTRLSRLSPCSTNRAAGIGEYPEGREKSSTCRRGAAQPRELFPLRVAMAPPRVEVLPGLRRRRASRRDPRGARLARAATEELLLVPLAVVRRGVRSRRRRRAGRLLSGERSRSRYGRRRRRGFDGVFRRRGRGSRGCRRRRGRRQRGKFGSPRRSSSRGCRRRRRLGRLARLGRPRLDGHVVLGSAHLAGNPVRE